MQLNRSIYFYIVKLYKNKLKCRTGFLRRALLYAERRAFAGSMHLGKKQKKKRKRRGVKRTARRFRSTKKKKKKTAFLAARVVVALRAIGDPKRPPRKDRNAHRSRAIRCSPRDPSLCLASRFDRARARALFRSGVYTARCTRTHRTNHACARSVSIGQTDGSTRAPFKNRRCVLISVIMKTAVTGPAAGWWCCCRMSKEHRATRIKKILEFFN